MTTVSEPAVPPVRAAGARSAHEILSWSRDVVDPALRSAVRTLPESMRDITGYHLGWWDEHGLPIEGGAGKALRPALTLLASDAAGGEPNAALPAAVAIELVHNFSLLHDDVMDGDATRRHRPTAWKVFGSSAAILAGDALLMLATNVLATSGHRRAQEAIRTLNTAALNLVDGQSADVEFEQREDVELAECLAMVGNKTGSLLECACSLGALFGDGSPRQAREFGSFGERLGLAFQHADDLLGIWADPAVTGKPTYSDLRSRKKSLPVVAALTSRTAAGTELADLYHREQPLSAIGLAHVAELIDSAGGRAWCQTQADELLTQALHHLRAAGPTALASAELSTLARMTTRRDH